MRRLSTVVFLFNLLCVFFPARCVCEVLLCVVIMAGYPGYTVTQLRQLLGERGLDSNGRKSQLIDRLLSESADDLDDKIK